MITRKTRSEAAAEGQRNRKRRPIESIDGVLHIPLSCGRTLLASDTPEVRELVEGREWSVPKSGYPNARFGGTIRPLHKLLMPEAKMLDHKNGDKLDCRLENLRPCTPSQNTVNRAIQPGKVRGVEKSGRKFRPFISINGKQVRLGSFDTEDEAITVRDIVARKIYGEFAVLNRPLQAVAS